MYVQAARLNTNDYNVRAVEKNANNNLDFSFYMEQATAMRSGDASLRSDKVGGEKDASSNYQSSVMLGGICWDDKTYADYVMRFKKVSINTDNPINWGTTGEHQLTKEEIDTLKSKYNVTNLSEQSFYDLMADLSNLNAIKPEDIISEYYEKTDGIMYNSIREIDYNFLENGKVIKNLLVKYYKEHSVLVNSAEFVKLDKFLLAQKKNPQLLAELKAGVQECYDEANRYYSVIAQLVRDPSDLIVDSSNSEEEIASLLSEKKEKLSFLETVQERADYYKAYSEMLNNAEFLKLSKSLFAPKPNPQLLLELEANAQERYEMA